MLDYLHKHAAAWEHLAYVRVRHVAGDAEFGETIQNRIVEACFNGSKDTTTLADAIAKMRLKLIKEHSRKVRELHIRSGRGAMMDVYFISRYLQLKHRIPNPQIPGTLPLIRHLNSVSVLSDESAELLYDGYDFLRHVDHGLRLMNERATRTLPQSEALVQELASGLSLSDAESFFNKYKQVTGEIGQMFDLLVQ
jgi:glutamate-ammonia-ligase adenylyltransferase